MSKYTPMQKVQRARMALLAHPTWCLYSGLLMLGKLELKELPMPTARTNGRDVEVDPRFVETLTEPELRFLLLHECEHKALRQLTTYAFLAKENPKLANVAMDFVVNQRIKDADAGEGFVSVIKGALQDDKYRGWSTKQVYDDLKKQNQNQPPQGQGKGGNGQGQMSKSGSEGGSPLDEHDIEGAAEMSEEEQEQLKQDIDMAVRQGGLLAGKLSGKQNRLLQDVLESQIRWQEILAEFVKAVTKGKDNSSWSKISRRWVSSGLYLPSSVAEAVGKLIVGIDASGSTWSGHQLEGFVSELIAICKDCVPEEVHVLWWDTKVQSVQKFKPEEFDSMTQVLKIEGGGGTSPSCVTDWLKKQEKKEYVAAIMLSDGYVGSDWGDWSDCGADGALPVLWCLNQKGVTSPVGQTLYCEGG